jgi:hypothetical protein
VVEKLLRLLPLVRLELPFLTGSHNAYDTVPVGCEGERRGARGKKRQFLRYDERPAGRDSERQRTKKKDVPSLIQLSSSTKLAQRLNSVNDEVPGCPRLSSRARSRHTSVVDLDDVLSDVSGLLLGGSFGAGGIGGDEPIRRRKSAIERKRWQEETRKRTWHPREAA